MRPAGYFVSPHVAHGAIWAWDPWTREWLGKKQHSSKQAETRDCKQKHRKKNMSTWPARLSVKIVSKLMPCFFTLIFRCSGYATGLTLLLESFARKSDAVTAFNITLPDPCGFS